MNSNLPGYLLQLLAGCLEETPLLWHPWNSRALMLMTEMRRMMKNLLASSMKAMRFSFWCSHSLSGANLATRVKFWGQECKTSQNCFFSSIQLRTAIGVIGKLFLVHYDRQCVGNLIYNRKDSIVNIRIANKYIMIANKYIRIESMVETWQGIYSRTLAVSTPGWMWKCGRNP